jgi:hypothetical protein
MVVFGVIYMDLHYDNSRLKPEVLITGLISLISFIVVSLCYVFYTVLVIQRLLISRGSSWFSASHGI